MGTTSSGGTGTPAIRYFMISAWCSSSCNCVAVNGGRLPTAGVKLFICGRSDRRREGEQQDEEKGRTTRELTHGRGREERWPPASPVRRAHKASPFEMGERAKERCGSSRERGGSEFLYQRQRKREGAEQLSADCSKG